MRRMLLMLAALFVMCVFVVFAEGPAMLPSVTLAEAYKILGPSHIVPASDAAHLWGLPQPDPATPALIRYHRDTLEWCADENESTASDWRLVYVFGLSLNDELRQIAEVRPKIEDLRPVDLWGSRALSFVALDSNDSWMSTHPEAGYYLVDCTPRFADLEWYDQQSELMKLRNVSRVSEAAFVEMVVACYGSSFVRIADNFNLFHRGPTLLDQGTALRAHVLATQDKLIVGLKPTDVERRRCGGTYVYRDFDF